MAKSKASFFCSECGHETSGWMGKCPGCGAWNTIVEEKATPSSSGSSAPGTLGAVGGWLAGLSDGQSVIPSAISLDNVSRDIAERYTTGIGELDRVLGGGLVKGSVVLVGGEPGIGKSTLLMQVCGKLAAGGPVAYISGEESFSQIGMRADRIGVKSPGIKLFPETSFESVAGFLLKEKPIAAVIDSIQTMYVPDVSSAPGSVTQVREATAGLLKIAKTTGISIILVGHVTKDGNIAGPRVLEHMVDTVLYFEGDKHSQYRIVRAVKNRFGATDEIGVFEMTDKGLSEVADPSSAMLEGRPRGVPGTVITSRMEGTRPVLVEIQALLNTVSYSNPQRVTQGIDRVRAGMILAVTDKKLDLGLYSMDAYINVVGGLDTNEPAADLAVAAAVISAVKDRPVRSGLVIFGELGLTGEIRPVSSAVRRAVEAAREGFEACIVPGSCRRQFRDTQKDLLPDLLFVDNIGEMVDILF